MTPVAREYGFELRQVDQLQLFSALEEAVKARGSNPSSKIESSAGDGSDRDPVLDGSVSVDQGLRVVNTERRPPLSPNGSRDMNWDGLGGEKPPQPSCGEVAQQRVRITGENTRETATVQREIRVSNRINTLVNPMQPSAGHCLCNRSFPKTHCVQLAYRGYAVLPCGQPRQAHPTRLSFPSHGS